MRALLLVLDSVGVGNAPDAATYSDDGANTLAHIFETVPDLRLPNLCALGLPEIVAAIGYSVGASPPPGRFDTFPARGRAGSNTSAMQQHRQYSGSYGRMQERSAGKDTTTGHWEIAGVILEEPFAVYERFPNKLVSAIERDAKVKFIGNYARSGTLILEELGAEHMRTRRPILYTSADSVLQIAAHEDVIPVERLYDIGRIARAHADGFRIGRVIARPFAGAPGNFKRTSRRHDFSMRPPRTVLDALREAGRNVIGVGKIRDIFNGRGISESFPTASNAEAMSCISALWQKGHDALLFANLVDFDMLYGHRRDAAGYANALSEFDQWLGGFLPLVGPDDLVMITADHGNDPTFRGTNHTREQVPLFVLYKGECRDLGLRETFADIAATLAEYFKLASKWPTGCSFLS